MAPLILIVLLFAIAWVVLILPKQRELKRHNALVASLRVGDEVMTGSGFYGTLREVDDDTVVLELAPGTTVKLARRAVAAKIVVPTDTPDAGDAPEAAVDGSDVEATPADEAAADEDVDR